MGYRAWLSPVKTKEEWETAYKSIMENELSYGINYCVLIEKKGTPFGVGEVVLAWAGDSSSSLYELYPSSSRSRTVLLDNIMEEDEAWGKDPNKFGTLMDYKTVVKHFEGE